MSRSAADEPRPNADATDELVAWAVDVLDRHDERFAAARTLAERLGAHYDPETGRTEVGFWIPEVVAAGIEDGDVSLEVLTPVGDVDLAADEQQLALDRTQIPLRVHDEFAWGVVDGMTAGTRDRLGALYRLSYRTAEGRDTVEDPLAYSVPFGAYGPAELYDMERLDEERADREYFRNLVANGVADPEEGPDDEDLPRVNPATSMLELHPGTAAGDGTLAGLAEVYERIDQKHRAGEALEPWERNYAGYDAVQVMPVEPLTENREREAFWVEHDDPDADRIAVTARRPDTINWGYDVVVRAFSAPNPAILRTGRPDELVDFIATLHTMERPIKVVFDVALGHADDGALELLNDRFFEGPGMYGQEIDYREPVVRATILELQRRKMDFGADGIRVDGAQDFTYWDPEDEREYHDDAFLAAMDEVVQTVAGVEYKPWMIYEDGRPWPREDWVLASTYRELIDQHPHSFQWSPISFANNTPALLTFWINKFWRLREVADFGSNWITGVANHDTIRRGTQIDATGETDQVNVNPYLGDTLPETLDRAYDNPASSMLFHAFMPGVPMDFLQGNARVPWGFVRNTDGQYNVKVVSEEVRFLDWQVTPSAFDDDETFPRLTALGFERLEPLREFARALAHAVQSTDYRSDEDADVVAAVLDAHEPPLVDREIDAEFVRAFCDAWMVDVYEFANVARHRDAQDDDHTAAMRAVREFRQERPWLRADLRAGDVLDHRQPADGTVLFYGYRESPDGDEQLLFVANMEGVAVDVVPTDLPIPDLPTADWDLALAAPGVADATPDAVSLADSQAVVFTRVT